MIPAGQMDKLVTIKSAVETQDSTGAVTQAWTTTVCTLWCRMMTTGQREIVRYGSVCNEASYVFEGWWQTGITSKMRVEYGSRVFQIVSAINVDEKSELIALVVKELT
jgi:SPP1 family predicted phage head-tail adaptor